MKFELQSWTIKELADRVGDHVLNLNPSYQRNEIWTAPDQRELISTIRNQWPLPSLFVLQGGDGHDEMVDGKQRALAIFNYLNNNLRGPDREYFDELPSEEQTNFLNYELPVVVITDLEKTERVEAFYALVNKSGIRLNRPEITKAEFAETPFHKLIDELVNDERLSSLGVFTERNTVRMNNYELVAELLATAEFGFFDKKKGVDDLYKISDKKDPIWARLTKIFHDSINILVRLDRVFPLKITRFRKRADFLSLTYFFWQYRKIPNKDLEDAHRVFSTIAPGIAPSNLHCDVLRSYAHYCVSQSHLKASRVARHEILSNLLANTGDNPTAAQSSVLSYFGLEATREMLIKGESWASLNVDILERNIPADHFFGEPDSFEFPL